MQELKAFLYEVVVTHQEVHRSVALSFHVDDVDQYAFQLDPQAFVASVPYESVPLHPERGRRSTQERVYMFLDYGVTLLQIRIRINMFLDIGVALL